MANPELVERIAERLDADETKSELGERETEAFVEDVLRERDRILDSEEMSVKTKADDTEKDSGS